jgi:hypothetical protein
LAILASRYRCARIQTLNDLPPEKEVSVPDRKLGGSQSRYRCGSEKEKFLPLPGTEPQSFSPQQSRNAGISAQTNETVTFYFTHSYECGPSSSVGIVTDYGLDGPGIESRWGEIFRTCPDRPWGLSRLLYNGYRLFPGSKVRPGRAADHSPPSSAEVMEE